MLRWLMLVVRYGSLATLLSACSNGAIYSNIQHNQRLECEKQPPSQYEKCMEEANRSYADYKQQREELDKP